MFFYTPSRKIARLFLVLLVCLGLFGGSPKPGKADIGPEPWAPGSDIGPATATQVRMVEEYVQMDLIDARQMDMAWLRFPQSSFVAKVQADFHMRNLGAEAEEMKVYFPLGRLDPDYYELHITDFQAWVDGQEARVEQMLVPKKEKSSAQYVSAYFSVHFPVDQEVLVHVSYTIGSKFVPGVGGMESLSYIFETGAGWKDSIGKAVLVVNLIAETSQESVMHKPEGGRVNGRSITWTWTDFEPTAEDNFYFELVDPGIWNEVLFTRQRVQQSPNDGAAWTRMGEQYFLLTSGKGSIEYPYFGEMAKSALQKAIQLSPYDRYPHYLLLQFNSSQMGKLERDLHTQAECDLLVSEMNQFLMRTESTDAYDGYLDTVLEMYGDLACPVGHKPRLTDQRGIYPTLTATPLVTGTAEPTQIPSLEATFYAYDQTRVARYETLLPSKTPTITMCPTRTRTSTAMSTLSPTRMLTLGHTSTVLPTYSPQPAVSERETSTDVGILWFFGVGVFFAGVGGYLWQHARRRREP